VRAGRAVHRKCSAGVSLLFAMLTLVGLSLAAVALVRAIDTGALVIGNLGFKQDTTAFAEQASEEAIAWLGANIAGNSLEGDIPVQGYYATSHEELDATGADAARTTRAVVDWNGNDCAAPTYASGSFSGGCLKPVASATVGGRSTQFLITRLCATTGSAVDPANSCAVPLKSGSSASPNRGSVDYASARFAQPAAGPYFRIHVRSSGARNSVTFTEALVHFGAP
jgi:type IV pilus assembly protein PilX